MQTHTSDPCQSLVDNSGLVYIPVELHCGVRVQCRPDVLSRCPLVLRDLNADLNACFNILPTSVHRLVRRTNVWVNTTYYYGPRDNPHNVNHTTAHHHEGWLLWARDKPEKARGIEIYNCFDYQIMRDHWQGCGLILHEICHLVHQIVLPDGLENVVVKNAFRKAKQSGLYNRTLRRDWAGLECEDDVAYAMVNYKEFFAEISVTYLSDGYSDLDHEDGSCMERCSPPLTSPDVAQRVERNRRFGVRKGFIACENDADGKLSSNESSPSENVKDKVNSQGYIANLLGLWNATPFSEDRHELNTNAPHCNKFFPFTRGQLKKHDPETWLLFSELWRSIEVWYDDGDINKCGGDGCWPWA